jgi:CheY-like chemotaxis protein
MTRLLLVEDSTADAILIREALRRVDVDQDVEIATDGVQALERLRTSGSPRPDLVLLDLNLPRMDGRAVLVEIKNDPDLCAIPVIILTTSASPADVDFAYRNHANSYVRKPLGLDRLVEAAQAIRDFWMRTATLPASADAS